MSTTTKKSEKEYLSAKELVNVVPKNRRIVRVTAIDKKYEYYHIGIVPPTTLSDEEKKGMRPVYWHDLSMDEVRVWNHSKEEWVVSDNDAPKYAVDTVTRELVGVVEETEEEKSANKKSKDFRSLLEEEI